MTSSVAEANADTIVTLALHPDSAKDANNIMERCMSFYKSEKLDNYVKNRILK